LEKRTAVHKANEAEITARWSFEDAVSCTSLYYVNFCVVLHWLPVCIDEYQFNFVQIKRPYFHVKPLEKGQLKMWKEYLDFEIEKGDMERIAILFERCLIACALYEEYWIRVMHLCKGQFVVALFR